MSQHLRSGNASTDLYKRLEGIEIPHFLKLGRSIHDSFRCCNIIHEQAKHLAIDGRIHRGEVFYGQFLRGAKHPQAFDERV
jgi:hypothetical protein